MRSSFVWIMLFVVVSPVWVGAQDMDLRPVCEAVGSKSEGWYQSGVRVAFAQCAGCLSACLHEGTDQEGWYNWCDQSLISAEPCAQSLPVFIDVPERHPLYDAIRHAASLGLVEGYPLQRAGKQVREFRSSAPVNRAEFVKIIIGALYDRERILRCTDVTFIDVDSDAWYAPYVCIASQEGVMQGHPDGTVRPSDLINFAEASAILTRAFALLSTSSSSSSSSSTSSSAVDDPWYRAPVEALAGRRAIPLSISSFDHELTRGELADLIYRLHVEDASRSTLTYDSIRTFSAPVVASSVGSSAQSSVAYGRFAYEKGWFSLAFPAGWQSVLANGVREPVTIIDTGALFIDPVSAEGFGVRVDVFTGDDFAKPADEPFFPFLRQMILPSLGDDAFENVVQDGWMLYHIRPPALPGSPSTYYVLFVRGDVAVLLNFPMENAMSEEIVASFQWILSSSASSASSSSVGEIPLQ